MHGTTRTGAALVAAAALGLAACGDSEGPVSDTFEFNATLEVGQTVEIKGVAGNIFAQPAAQGEDVMVSASKAGAQDDPSTVTIEVVEHDGGVTLCAVYPNVSGQPTNTCAPGLEGNLSAEDNDVRVTFIVSVPPDVGFVGRTVVGNVDVQDLDSPASGHTVTGNVNLFTTRFGEASTTTGGVVVSLGLEGWDQDLEFSSVSGNVLLRIPQGTNAEVRATTGVDGLIISDFQLVDAEPGTKVGTLGTGGPMLTLSTVGGNISLEHRN